jgi:hypothetical protein
MFGGECSHIISIFENHEEKPTEKGNLYLSGAYTIKDQDEMKRLHIKCVLTIIDRDSYKSLKVQRRLKEAGVE